MRTSAGTVRTIALTIAGTLGASLLLGMLNWCWTLEEDVRQLKEEQIFYHGAEWPPPRGGVSATERSVDPTVSYTTGGHT